RKDGELVRRSAGRGALLTGLTAVAVPTCCASAGPAVISAAASGNAMRFPIMTRPRRERLVNDRQLSADHGGDDGLDQLHGAAVELRDRRKHTDNQNETCAQKANDNDLQVCPAIGAIDRMIHGCLRFWAPRILDLSKARFRPPACHRRHKRALCAKWLRDRRFWP